MRALGSFQRSNKMEFWRYVMGQKSILITLFIANLLGTIYGYIWYGSQLLDSKWYFWPFIPDSPTATLFLVIAIAAIYFNKHLGLFECLAFITLIKYGVWAVVMNIFVMIHYDQLVPMAIMLMTSHGIMAIQALMFYPLFNIKKWHIVVTMIWVFHNDVIDYVYHQYPVYSMLSQYESHIGYFAFWLSIIAFLLLLYFQKNIKLRSKYLT